MIRIENLTKYFNTADGEVCALKNVNIEIKDGDIFGIIGMSGAGKSTLVRCINMLERPTSGNVFIDDVDIGKLSAKKLREARRDITMIFQGFNLLQQRSCIKNVMFPLELAGEKKSAAKKRALELLEIVGLKDKANAYPAQLSGGQQQRVAIARALATEPKVLLCDEATSALDPTTTNSILELIRSINEKLGITVIIITHQMSVVESVCKRVAIMDHGEVAEQGDVAQIFAHPSSKAAKRLVYPEFSDEENIFTAAQSRLIRVTFNGAKAAQTPIIANLAIEKGIKANIAYAATKGICEKAYGSMLLSIEGDDETVRNAIEYFRSTKDISAEEVERDV